MFVKEPSKPTKESETFQGILVVSLLQIFRLTHITKENETELKSLLKRLHKSKDYSNHLIFLSNFCKTAFEVEKGQECLKYLYDFELSYHNGNLIECEECLKKNIGTNYICQYVIDAKYPGVVETYLIPGPIKAFIHNITINRYWMKIMRPLKVVFYYLDFAKDVVILLSICASVPLTVLAFNSFSAQIILLYFLSILVPLLVNWIYVAFFNLEEICGCFNQTLATRSRYLAQVLTFLFAPFLPGCIIYQREWKSEMIQTCVDEIVESMNKNGENSTEKVIELGRKSKDLKNQKLKLKSILATITKCEMLEAIFQIILNMCLLSMNYWKISLTANELQEFFNEDFNRFLALTIPLSVKKILTSMMSVKSASKNGFAPMIGLVIYCVHAFISVSVRITSIIIYFSVPLGLFNILTHWVYENVKERHGLTWRKYDESRNPVKFSIFDGVKDQYDILEIKDIAPRLLTDEHYTKYTGLTLQMYYVLFIVGMFVHFAVVILLDMVLKQHFGQRHYVKRISEQTNNKQKDLKIPDRKNNTNSERWNWFAPVIHSLTSFAIPETSRDWDDLEEDYRTPKANQILIVS